MKIGLAVFLLLSTASCWSQSHAVAIGKAHTAGCGSPIVTGHGNKFTITCQGIPDALRSQILDLLNRIAENQVNSDEIVNKLNTCVEGVRQVQEQQLPWRLSEVQKTQLARILQELHAHAEIYLLNPGGNSEILGDDLLPVLQSVGWIDGLHSFTTCLGCGIPPPDLVGIRVVANYQGFLPADRLSAALTSFGIPTENVVDNNLARTPDAIVIEVGEKP